MEFTIFRVGDFNNSQKDVIFESKTYKSFLKTTFLSHRGTFTADPESTSSAGRVSDGWSSVSSGGGSDCGCGGISQVL